MSADRNRLVAAVSLPVGRESLRHLILNTFPGRAAVLGAAGKVVVAATRSLGFGGGGFVDAIDRVSALALVLGIAYFVWRAFARAKRRLLWRVRRKLILSYVFVGFVPALLIAIFFLLCGLLLVFHVSSYLVQRGVEDLKDRAAFVAQATALEVQRGPSLADAKGILARRQTAAEASFPGASLALAPTEGLSCRPPAGERQATRSLPWGAVGTGKEPARPRQPSSVAAVRNGAWVHLDPPHTLPSWIPCEGFSGLVAYRAGQDDIRLVVRAVAFPDDPNPRYGIVVDLPLNAEMVAQLRQESGISIDGVTEVPIGIGGSIRPMDGGVAGGAARAPEDRMDLAQAGVFPWITALDFVDWTRGERGSLTMTIVVSPRDLYDRLSAGQTSIGGRGFRRILPVALAVVGGLFLIIECAALVMGAALARSITGSVHQLFQGTERVRAGDFTHKIEVGARDQLGELADSFNLMTASIEDLLQQAAEKRRLEEELRIAREIQMSLLPQGPLRMPGLSVSAVCVPAREVGGDYYDYMRLDEDRLALLIADVAGKGTSAALYMAELKGIMSSLSRAYRSPRELLIHANRIIAESLDSRSFITMTYAVLDLHSRTMTYARAGHTPLIHRPQPGEEPPQAHILAPNGLVLGLQIDRGEKFVALLEEVTLPVNPGDVFVLFTDGISEAMNEQSDCFGEARLGQLVAECGHLPPKELRDRVLTEIAGFAGRAAQHDDMTLIVVRIDEPLAAATRRTEAIDAAVGERA